MVRIHLHPPTQICGRDLLDCHLLAVVLLALCEFVRWLGLGSIGIRSRAGIHQPADVAISGRSRIFFPQHVSLELELEHHCTLLSKNKNHSKVQSILMIFQVLGIST